MIIIKIRNYLYEFPNPISLYKFSSWWDLKKNSQGTEEEEVYLKCNMIIVIK